MSTHFVDRVTLHVSGGNGGDGCVSVHREKFKPLGGPDGGNGGNGGDVRLLADPGVHTLLDFHYHPHQQGTSGSLGRGNNRSGANGTSRTLKVPLGTVVYDTKGEQLADLSRSKDEYIVARGGRGGLGNAALATRKNKAPQFALLGEPGESRDVVLELKSIADVGLIGFPSAGKSSLIGRISGARPKIAEYPFTTLTPNLGVVSAGDVTFTVADVPGLIPGASAGKGLGAQFLRHIERCAVLVHVIDTASFESHRDPLSDIDAIEKELSAYLGQDHRPRVIALNKIDVPDARELVQMLYTELRARSWPVFEISAVSGEGVDMLLYHLAQVVSEHRQQVATEEPPVPVLRPRALDEEQFTVVRDPDEENTFIVSGEKPQRWVYQTQFGNEEAVRYLAHRLKRLGVEDELVKLGADEGATVVLGEFSFTWEPSEF